MVWVSIRVLVSHHLGILLDILRPECACLGSDAVKDIRCSNYR
jgi:hypothetical protein